MAERSSSHSVSPALPYLSPPTTRIQFSSNDTDTNNSSDQKPLAENNPGILTPLAHALGLSRTYAFHDLYSFSDADLLAVVPRPALALLFVYPHTETAQAWLHDEVAAEPAFEEVGEEPVLWFRQTVVNGEFYCPSVLTLSTCLLASLFCQLAFVELSLELTALTAG